MRKRPIEIGFANVRHGNQPDRLAIVANVFSHLNRQTLRAQRHETFAEMIHRQSSATDKINHDSGQQHENVHHQEYGQVPPAKAPDSQPVLSHQRPAKFKAALDPVEDIQAEDDLTQRDDPGNLLKLAVAINQEWNSHKPGGRIEKCEREKQAFRNQGSQSHQPVDDHCHERGDQEQNPTDHRKEVNIKKEDQRGIEKRSGCIGQKQSEAQA